MTGRLPLIVGLTVVAWVCLSCASNAKFGLTDGRYEFKQVGQPSKQVDVYFDKNDSLRIFEKPNPVIVNVDQPGYLRKKTFDLDAVTIPFKFRPVSFNFPRQLTTDFNGNIYLGYRMDRFKVSYRHTPVGLKRKISQIGFSGGVFGGLGTTFISAWTTNYRTTDEYSGFILSRGLALLVGTHNLTFGFGVGWDYLTDRDREIWIYQNKPWYGLAVGLNVN